MDAPSKHTSGMSKLWPGARSALDGIVKDGMLLAIGGFGLCGIPEALIVALRLKYYPSTTVPGAALTSTNYIRNALSPTDSTQFNQRIDWIENNKSSWFGRFSWGNDLQDVAGSVGDSK